MSAEMLANFLLKIFISALILQIGNTKYEGYRFKLDVGNPNKLCPAENFKCSDGSDHYLCPVSRNPKCICHKPVVLSGGLIKTFLEATNGIRNKVAGDLEIANMNLVYWSHELMEMANIFLRQCFRGYDPCLVVGEKHIKVSQNHVFFEGQIVERWPGRMVRHWYYEMGKGVKTFKDFIDMHKTGTLENITNLISPLVEFVGCGAARFADGYFIVCYYHPPHDHRNFPKDYALGDPCTKCSPLRTVCSKTFSNLCGVDFEWTQETATRETLNIFLLLLCILFVNLL